jgi:hypothetical protein
MAELEISPELVGMITRTAVAFVSRRAMRGSMPTP